MIQSIDLSRLKTGLELLESQEQKRDLIIKSMHLRNEVPFSRQLNVFIRRQFKLLSNNVKFVFTDKDDFDEDDLKGTFLRHYKRFQDTNEIHIWTGASDNTIFGEQRINHYFRAWHDYIHLTNNLGYDSVGESIVCDIQTEQLPTNWLFERELLHIEVVGQIHYHALNHKFVEDQRQFTIDYLLNPLKALK